MKALYPEANNSGYFMHILIALVERVISYLNCYIKWKRKNSKRIFTWTLSLEILSQESNNSQNIYFVFFMFHNSPLFTLHFLPYFPLQPFSILLVIVLYFCRLFLLLSSSIRLSFSDVFYFLHSPLLLWRLESNPSPQCPLCYWWY